MISFFSTLFAHSTHSLCIVGAGPAGIFAAKHLHKHERLGRQLKIDIYDRLTTPGGLLRYGVAPDSSEIKKALGEVDRLLSSTATRYIGGVNVVGSSNQPKKFQDLAQISLGTLRKKYDAVVLAIGTQRPRKLDIPGRKGTLPIISAFDLVRWYNGLGNEVGSSDYEKKCFKKAVSVWDVLARCNRPVRAIILGHGNAALDVTRMISRPPPPDIPMQSDVRKVLQSVKFESIEIVGRGSLADVAFSPHELRKLSESTGKRLAVDPKEYESLKTFNFRPPNGSTGSLFNRRERRLASLFRQISKNWPLGSIRILSLREPLRFESSSENSAFLGGVSFSKFNKGSGAKTVEFRPADLVVESLGFEMEQHNGIGPVEKDGSSLFTDSTGKLMTPEDGSPVYCIGWCRTGAKGTIAHVILEAMVKTISSRPPF